jgi:hypothetical protein
MEELEHGIDLGRIELGGSGEPMYIPLSPTAEDEAFFESFKKHPLITRNFAAGVSPKPDPAPDNPDAPETNTPTVPGKGRVLSFLATKQGFRWLDRQPIVVFILSGVLLLLGLVCLLTLVSGSSRTAVVVEEVPPVTIAETPLTVGTGLNATVTAQAGQLTLLATRPTATPPPATTTTPAPSPTLDLSLEPHKGLSPPKGVAVPGVGFSNGEVRRFQNTGDGQSLIGVPPKGIIYHFGAYPGEEGGNVVMLADYETIGKMLELLQVNDLVQVQDRGGGTYTYRVLPWDLITAQAAGTGIPRNFPTPSTALPKQYQQATEVASIPYEVEKVTTWQDTALVESPKVGGLSVLTLIALGRSGDDPGRRYAIRGKFVSYAPTANLPPGTPVVIITPTVTPAG